jgi:hypothetical protein
MYIKIKTEKFTGPNKVLMVLGRRTCVHREDFHHVVLHFRCKVCNIMWNRESCLYTEYSIRSSWRQLWCSPNHQLLREHQSYLTCLSLTLMSRHQLLGEHQSYLTCLSLTLMSRHQLLGEHQSCLTCLSSTLMSRHQLLGEHQSYLTCPSLTLMSRHQLLGEHDACSSRSMMDR